MLNRVWRGVACGALLLSCSCLSAIAAANQERARAAVEWTLRNFNACLTRGDTSSIRQLVRANFRLIEDSVEYDLASAVTAVATAHEAGKITRELTDLKIERRGALAWATYKVRASFVSGRDTLRFTRQESAVLEHGKSQWNIAFMTSAPAPPQH